MEEEQVNKTILRLLILKHRDNPEELELWKQAWVKYPTLKKDCRTEKDFKALARDGFVSKLKKLKQTVNG